MPDGGSAPSCLTACNQQRGDRQDKSDYQVFHRVISKVPRSPVQARRSRCYSVRGGQLMTAPELDFSMRLVACALSRVRRSHWIDVRQTRPSSGVPIGRTRERDRERSFVSGHSCAPAAGAGSAGPVNSASIENSTKSPTPIVVPGAGRPNVIPKSDRLSEPCAENPTRALGSI